jgi:spore coat protein A, manganese oxidase
MTLNRRQFLVAATLVGGAAAASALPSASAAPATSTPAATEPVALVGADYLAKFTRQLPRPSRIDLTGAVRSATVTARRTDLHVLSGYPKTTCYGYDGSWPGPTIFVREDRPAHITWRNRLPVGSVALADGGHLLPVDAALLEADMLALPAGQLPTVAHLHGGHTEWESDGHPEGWFTQNGTTGSTWKKYTYSYANDQRAAALWYHDHSMGLTRLNIFAGLAGHFIVRDAVEGELIEHGVLPDPTHEHELMIQDRSFTSDGQLYLPLGPGGQDPIDFYGDFMCVNGAPWPVLDVEQRKHRFRIANGCDSRFLVLTLSNKASLLVVGSDQGLLPAAVSTKQLLVAPGERYDVVIDFSAAKHGETVTLLNIGVDNVLLGFQDSTGTLTNRATDTPVTFGPPPAPGAPPGPPAPSTSPADPESTGMVMKFRVERPRTRTSNATVRAGSKLAGPYPHLNATKTRGVMTAFVGAGPGGAGMEMLGSIEDGTAAWMDPVTERVKLGSTEIWEIHNTGPVTHPIHLHLVDFEVLDRAPFTFTSETSTMADGSAGIKITVTGAGTRRPPEAWETGRKDTVVCYPGEVTRVVAKFDRTGNYVWHCHLLHHEDHGMMRPMVIS